MKFAAALTFALFLVSAVAVPAMAHGDDDRGAHHRDAAEDAADVGNRSADDNRSRDHRMDREERHNATMERLKARCEAAENRTGREIPACDRLGEIHDGAHKARRAAHAGMQAISAWEHLNATLGKLEAKFEEKLASGNLTENQTAAFEAKLERIDAMQENLTAKIEAMQEKLEGMHARWQEVRDHVEERRAFRGDDDGEDEEESEDESEEEEEEEEEQAEGNATADA